MALQKNDRELSDADYRNLAEFRFMLRRFLQFSENAARKAGLKPQQHQALLVVRACQPDERCTVGHLAERLVIRHNSAVGLVDRLVRAGFLRRIADKDDRRRVALALTDKGDAVLATVSAANREELRHLRPPLTALFSKLER